MTRPKSPEPVGLRVKRTLIRPTVQLLEFRQGERALERLEFFVRLKTDEALRSLFSQTIGQSPWPAVLWETPVLCAQTVNKPFSCVLLASEGLRTAQAEPEPFREHLSVTDQGQSIVQFSNLGGDATLVVPCQVSAEDHYTHLKRFVTAAPTRQVHRLWARVGQAVEAWILTHDKPVWVSTNGLGVFWLHVRLDEQPKYFRHAPYRLAFQQTVHRR